MAAGKMLCRTRKTFPQKCLIFDFRHVYCISKNMSIPPEEVIRAQRKKTFRCPN